jgi:hypothetical protein
MRRQPLTAIAWMLVAILVGMAVLADGGRAAAAPAVSRAKCAGAPSGAGGSQDQWAMLRVARGAVILPVRVAPTDAVVSAADQASAVAVAAGRGDASGQALRAGGSGKMLSFLVTAGWGPVSGTGQVVYADGSTQKFMIGAPDWSRSCSSPKASGVVVYTSPSTEPGSAAAGVIPRTGRPTAGGRRTGGRLLPWRGRGYRRARYFAPPRDRHER